jgi:cellulose synthase/poly-beta-1,6-N-acetylglucosamine synthase-like glycosyltransferase
MLTAMVTLTFYDLPRVVITYNLIFLASAQQVVEQVLHVTIPQLLAVYHQSLFKGHYMEKLSFGSVLIALFFWLSLGGILYTYFGYPLLIYLLAKFARRSETSLASEPSVTLLIAAYNEEKIIEEKIKNSLAVDYPRDLFQVLIVADGSSDQTAEIVQGYTGRGVELLYQPERRGKMAAINRALPQARGEIIVFSDANNLYLPDTIRNLIRPFGDPEVGATTGAKVIVQGDGSLGASEGLYWKYESFVKKQESLLGSCTSAAGEVLGIRKDLYVQPPNNIINDDFYIAMQVVRRGYRLLYVPDAKSFERVSPSARDEVTRRTRINAGRFQAIALAGQILPLNRPLLIWQIVSHKFMRPLVPFGMIGAALFNLLAVLFPPQVDGLFILSKPYSIILLSLQAVFYALAWIGTRSEKRGEQNKLLRLFYLPAFLTNSNLAALMGFFKFLRGGQSHLWERIQRR